MDEPVDQPTLRVRGRLLHGLGLEALRAPPQLIQGVGPGAADGGESPREATRSVISLWTLLSVRAPTAQTSAISIVRLPRWSVVARQTMRQSRWPTESVR